LTQSDYVSIQWIAKTMKVSRRTIYYDIEKINLWLKQLDLPRIEVVREKGLFVSHREREQIQTLLLQDTQQSNYTFSPEERAKIIICYMIYAQELIYLEQLTECLEVSRNTIFTDLKEVSKLLEQYELALDYQPKYGYRIDGDEVRIRALFMLYYNELAGLFHSGMLKFYHPEPVAEYLEKLQLIEQELRIKYVEGVLPSIATLIPLLYHHQRPIIFTGLKPDEIEKKQEYALVKKYFPDLVPDEQLYLALHLLGSRINLVQDEFLETRSNTEVYDLTTTLISEFEKTACVVFDNQEELQRSLFIHLNTSLYRYRFGVQIGNMLGDDVRKEYPDLFALTKISVRHLEQQIGFPIPDSEIAYLALHFGGFLKIANDKDDQLRILIVCGNGISTGNMIKREVKKLLPFAKIVDVVAAMDLVNAQDICDLIISTVKVSSVVPSITVHPILTELDRKSILAHRLVSNRSITIQREQLFQVVKPYVKPEEQEALLQDLTAYLLNNNPDLASDSPEEYNLLEILDTSRVHLFKEECQWQNSIRITGECLVENLSIDRHYLEAIISLLHHYGPYMFLNDEVILAHAKPEDGVNCLDVSIGIFQHPVRFSSSRMARIVIILAAEDQEKHLRILQDILKIITDPDCILSLQQCSSSQDALQLFQHLLITSETQA
jgi:transcriptional antiterminator/mannitol/fructose-specific phosphotransferase system IIA component (Ntr-type)